MNFAPKISIIVPNLNNGNFLGHCLLSIIKQNYSNLEIIVIDGGSSDNSIEVIKQYENKLHYWVSEPDSGQSEAINKGLKIASGDIINWLNSDDYLEPGALHKIVNIFGKSNANVVCGRSNIIRGEEIVKITNGSDVYKNNLAKTIGWARIDQPETYFKSEILKSITPLNENLHFIMDRDLWIKYLLNFGLDKIVETDDIFVNFRLHEKSKTVSQQGAFNCERNSYYYQLAIQLFDKKYAEILKKNYKINKNLDINPKPGDELLYSIINYFFILLFKEAYAERDFHKARFLKDVIEKNSIEAVLRNEIVWLANRMKIIPGWIYKIKDSF